MKIITALVLSLPLVAFITWLSQGTTYSGATRFDAAMEQLDRIVETEAALHRDVLSTRAGLLRNYDPLVRETNELRTEIARLRDSMASDTAATVAIDRLANSLTDQEGAVERFKSINALLQNSLAYFAMFSANLTMEGENESLGVAVSMLATAMLRLTLDTSPAAAVVVQTKLDQFAQRIPIDRPRIATALLAHGELLHNLLPTADQILRSLAATPPKAEEVQVRTIIRARQNALRADAQRFRIVLFVTSLCLVGLLVWAGMRLRLRTQAIQRRARFEHVLSRVSMHFVTARALDLDGAIDAALEQMARCVGAERAYFVVGNPPDRIYRWSMPGIGFPPGWPGGALALGTRAYPSFGNVTQVVRLRRLRPGADREALAANGLQGWACVARMADRATMLLGFDAVTHPCRIMREGELGLLRMALDIIASALGRRALEQERQRLESKLQQARRLETIGALASGIAHNFNNIVGAILGYVEMAGERDGPSHTLEEIHRAGERARELVDQILTFAGRRDARHIPVDMHVVVVEAVSLLRASLPATVEVSVSETFRAAVVSGVHAQLLQVVLNLGNNAAQAMDNAGHVELDVASEDLRMPRSLSHGSLLPGQYVRIAVNDFGRGIDETALDRIFEPFFTTRVAGNGLGLATAREIVREHGGAIHVESVPYHGSRFEVWLPSIDTPASTSASEPSRFMFGQGETVLVLETNGDRLMQDEELLAAVGYEPVGFTRAEDARDAYLASPQRFDAALLVHVSPPESGLEFTRMLRRVSPALPVVMATPASDGFAATALVAAGVSEVVSCPIEAGEIATVLHDHLQRAGGHRTHETAET